MDHVKPFPLVHLDISGICVISRYRRTLQLHFGFISFVTCISPSFCALISRAPEFVQCQYCEHQEYT